MALFIQIIQNIYLNIKDITKQFSKEA